MWEAEPQGQFEAHFAQRNIENIAQCCSVATCFILVFPLIPIFLFLFTLIEASLLNIFQFNR